MTSPAHFSNQMAEKPWTCRDTPLHILAYRDGELETPLADQLFDHALACDHCFQVHWQPFQEESTAVMGMLLDSLEADAQGEQGLETVSGDHTVLTVSDWISPVDLPIASPDSHSEAIGMTSNLELISAVHGPHLRQIGVLLPKVPRRSLVSGYELYLGDGIPQPERTLHTSALLRVRLIKGEEVLSIEALREGVTVDNRPLAPFQPLTLQQAHLIELPGMLLYWQDLSGSGGGAAGDAGLDSVRPGTRKSKGERVGLGLLRFKGPSFPLDQARQSIGRGDKCAIRLPSREVRTNLKIEPEAFAAADSQEIEQVIKLTLDAVEVSREHAALVPESTGATSTPSFRVEALSDYPLYLWSQGRWQGLTKAQSSTPLNEGDELLIGQSLFRFCQA